MKSLNQTNSKQEKFHLNKITNAILEAEKTWVDHVNIMHILIFKDFWKIKRKMLTITVDYFVVYRKQDIIYF